MHWVWLLNFTPELFHSSYLLRGPRLSDSFARAHPPQTASSSSDLQTSRGGGGVGGSCQLLLCNCTRSTLQVRSHSFDAALVCSPYKGQLLSLAGLVRGLVWCPSVRSMQRWPDIPCKSKPRGRLAKTVLLAFATSGESCLWRGSWSFWDIGA